MFFNLFLSILVALGEGSGAVMETTAIAQPPRAGLCELALGVAKSIFETVYNDPVTVGRYQFIVAKERLAVRNALANAKSPEFKQFETYEDFASWKKRNEYWYELQLDQMDAKWKTDHLQLTVANLPYVASLSRRATLMGLIMYLEQAVPRKFSAIAIDTVSALVHFPKIREWARGVREEIWQMMWDEGLRNIDDFNNPILGEHFLDLALARRAKAKGFKIGSNGKPKNMRTEGPFSFLWRLARGHVFVDWTGQEISAGNQRHYSRGHLIAMVYLAEHVPQFVELIKFIGRTADKHGIWKFLFDNADSIETPFWTGFWVHSFQRYFGIRY